MPERQIRKGDRVTLAGTVRDVAAHGVTIDFDGEDCGTFILSPALAKATIEPRLLTPEEVIARKREKPKAKFEYRKEGKDGWILLDEYTLAKVFTDPGWQFREVEVENES